MAEVVLKNVSKIFDGKNRAVDSINLIIPDKEFVVLVGPSGCGKSTTLRMIAGLEEISEGEIFIGGIRVNEIPPKDRDIAMVFQNYALYPHMSVYDNMAFGLKLRKFPKSEIKERVYEAAEILDIKYLLDRKPKQLSGGQRQRVAVGRAIVRKPKVFLFDEPLSNLDAKLRVQMRAELTRLHQKLETTVVYVTHDQTEAMTMGNRIVVMKDGIVQQVDSPLNFYQFPVNLFVAGFIGSPAMNFIPGKIIKDQKLIFVSLGGEFSLSVDDEKVSALQDYAGQTVTIGIRPENIELAGPESANKFEVLFELVEQMGNEVFIHFRIDGIPLIARAKPQPGFSPGCTARFSVNAKLVHFFKSESGRKII